VAGVNALLMAAFGAAAGLGLFVAVAGACGRTVLPRAVSTSPAGARAARLLATDRLLLRLSLAGGIAVLTLTVTRWVVVAAVGAMVGWLLPSAIAAVGRHRREVARVEAIAAWAEQLRDTLSAANGLEHAIGASARVAPAPIAPAVERLAVRLEFEPLPTALRGFADDVDHPLADFITAALVIAAEKEARELTPLLGHLAGCARDEARMLQRVWVGRARTRTTVRVIAVVVVVFVAGLLAFDREYLAPYDSALGQAVLLVIAGTFAASFAAMERMGRISVPDRFIGRRSSASTAAVEELPT
jgi:hypothetical protein